MKLDPQAVMDKSVAKYITVIALGRRIRDLQTGHKPLVNKPLSDPEAVALEELAKGKIVVQMIPVTKPQGEVA